MMRFLCNVYHKFVNQIVGRIFIMSSTCLWGLAFDKNMARFLVTINFAVTLRNMVQKLIFVTLKNSFFLSCIYLILFFLYNFASIYLVLFRILRIGRILSSLETRFINIIMHAICL